MLTSLKISDTFSISIKLYQYFIVFFLLLWFSILPYNSFFNSSLQSSSLPSFSWSLPPPFFLSFVYSLIFILLFSLLSPYIHPFERYRLFFVSFFASKSFILPIIHHHFIVSSFILHSILLQLILWIFSSFYTFLHSSLHSSISLCTFPSISFSLFGYLFRINFVLSSSSSILIHYIHYSTHSFCKILANVISFHLHFFHSAFFRLPCATVLPFYDIHIEVVLSCNYPLNI